LVELGPWSCLELEGGGVKLPSHPNPPQSHHCAAAMSDTEPKLCAVFIRLLESADRLSRSHTAVDYRGAVARCTAAASAAGRIRGALGACLRSRADLLRCECLLHLRNLVACADAACAAWEYAIAAGEVNVLVMTLTKCSQVAQEAPEEMAEAMNRRKVDTHRGDPWWVDHTARPLRLALGFGMASVAVCECARAGTVSPELHAKAIANLGSCLNSLHEQPQKSMLLHRRAVTLCRRAVQKAHPGADGPRRVLRSCLGSLGTLTGDLGMAES